MADFNKALDFVLPSEGGFSNDPDDSGGATNFGISLRFLQGLPEANLRKYGFHIPPDLMSIEQMTLQQATMVYEGEFWSAAQFCNIQRQSLANYTFDMCVNHGISEGIKLLQRGICATHMNRDFLVCDGVLGDKTINALANASLHLPEVLIAQRAQFMRDDAARRNKDQKFLDGWLNRAFRFI